MRRVLQGQQTVVRVSEHENHSSGEKVERLEEEKN